MLPSLFSTMTPSTPYQWLFMVYCYVLPVMLYGAWAAISLMDMFESPRADRSAGWGLAVLLVPLAGGAAYLLSRATRLTSKARIAIVVGGLLVWLIPLAFGLSRVLGPLGPKALN
jgi:hypothetical protein